MKKIFRCGINLYANYKNFCERIWYSRLIYWYSGFRGGERNTMADFFLMKQKHLISERREAKKIGQGVWVSPKNASPRLSPTNCFFVDRTSKVSIKHRKDTALNLKKKSNTTFISM